MAKQQSLQSLSQLFHVLSDETRVRLLVTLRGGEKHVTELCKRLRVPQPTVSHHLALLRVHGLVHNRRQGKSVFYSVNPTALKRSIEGVRAIFAGQVR